MEKICHAAQLVRVIIVFFLLWLFHGFSGYMNIIGNTWQRGHNSHHHHQHYRNPYTAQDWVSSWAVYGGSSKTTFYLKRPGTHVEKLLDMPIMNFVINSKVRVNTDILVQIYKTGGKNGSNENFVTCLVFNKKSKSISPFKKGINTDVEGKIP